MNNKQQKKLYSSRVHEPSGRWYTPYRLSTEAINSIKQRIDMSTDKIAFMNGKAPKSIEEVVKRYIKDKEDVGYVRKSKLVVRGHYPTRSRIDAYRLACYYLKNVDIHEVFKTVEKTCNYHGYCWAALRHMFK